MYLGISMDLVLSICAKTGKPVGNKEDTEGIVEGETAIDASGD